jgi:hypothetical protein
MNTDTAIDMNAKVIAANLEALHFILLDAVKLSAEAHELMKRGNRNGAIGAAFGLQVALEDAKALHGAALAIHRTRWS